MKPSALLPLALLSATGTSAMGPQNPIQGQRLEGKPSKIDSWRWPNPFTTARYKKFTPSCTASATFAAHEFLLDDLSLPPPEGLLPYREALKKVFASREYPGSWDGVDPHGYDRNLLVMKYSDVPLKVREWIEEQERGDGGKGKGLFAVYERAEEGGGEGEKVVEDTVAVPEATPVGEAWRAGDEGRVVVFAPGAVYEVLPLWVAEGSDCEESLLDLSKYSAKPADGGVVAYPVEHTRAKRGLDKRSMKFQVKAEVLALKAEDAGDAAKTEEGEKAKVETAEELKAEEKDEL